MQHELLLVLHAYSQLIDYILHIIMLLEFRELRPNQFNYQIQMNGTSISLYDTR